MCCLCFGWSLLFQITLCVTILLIDLLHRFIFNEYATCQLLICTCRFVDPPLGPINMYILSLTLSLFWYFPFRHLVQELHLVILVSSLSSSTSFPLSLSFHLLINSIHSYKYTASSGSTEREINKYQEESSGSSGSYGNSSESSGSSDSSSQDEHYLFGVPGSPLKEF